ncbi:unnamed protein product [Pleuronectes platessa]|uniref:Uncharacterized protein n=1 Tax=Pleuronectes platessa TaxID=8262 RepID=A0A9N7VGN6_PLEPL|nr:unnamed protein product [Pleuronectes platessa]
MRIPLSLCPPPPEEEGVAPRPAEEANGANLRVRPGFCCSRPKTGGINEREPEGFHPGAAGPDGLKGKSSRLLPEKKDQETLSQTRTQTPQHSAQPVGALLGGVVRAAAVFSVSRDSELRGASSALASLGIYRN